MKTILPALFAFFLLLGSGDANSIDGTILADGRKPDRPFPKAFAEATKALGNDAPKFSCYKADAITPAAKGGWQFFFGSAERKCVVIYIRRDGTHAQEPTASDEFAFPPAPRLSIQEALAAADAVVQKRLKEFFFTGASWYADDGTWRVSFRNPAASWTCVTVDPSRAAKLGSVNRRNR